MKTITQLDRVSFAPDHFDQWIRPCVYLFLRYGEPLYIGSSVNGMMRFACPNHHQRHVRQQSDEVLVLWFASAAEAKEMEKHLIADFTPKFNRIGNGKQRAAA